MIKHFTIYNYKLANELLDLGYQLVRIDRNQTVNGWLVFHFVDSAGLRQIVDKYTNK